MNRRWGILLAICLLLLLAAVIFWGVHRHRRQVALEQAEATWEERYAQDVAALEARYAENREALQVVVEAFQQDAQLEMIHRNDPDEYPAMDGYGYYDWKNFQGLKPELYQALAALEENGLE